MAYLDQEYDVKDLLNGEEDRHDLIPPGWYDVAIHSAELRQTKSGTGEYIAIRYDVTGPTHQGRVVFGNLNIKNQSQKAEEIGRKELGYLMRAIGLARVTDTDQLIGGRLQIKIAVGEAKGQYDAANEVKGYKAATGHASAADQSAHAPAATPAKAAPPWAKR